MSPRTPPSRLTRRIEYQRWRLARRIWVQDGISGVEDPDVLRVQPLDQAHVAGCQLLANRDVMIRDHLPKNAVVAEVGVHQGHNAKTILEGANPRELHLIDLTFSNLQRELIEPALSDGVVRLVEKDSAEALATFPDGYFDWIYIDGNHYYHWVKRDIDVAKRKIKPDGLLVFNDYILFSHAEFVFYGVISAVNELCMQEDWTFRYFALATHMYCDVAIGRSQSNVQLGT